MLNKVILIGRWVRDPELRYTPNGTAVANCTMAVDRRKKDDGTDFINVVMWGRMAESAANHTSKGTLVAVEGRLQIRSYEANDGGNRKTAEVVAENIRFLEWRKNDNSSSGSGLSSGITFNEDDIPF